MGRLGYFRRSKDRSVEFVPFSHANHCDQFYGLTDLNIKSLDALEREVSLADMESSAAAVPKQRNLFVRKAAQIAASVAVLIGLGIMLTTPVIVDRSQQASLAPKVTAPQPQQVEVTVQQDVVPEKIEKVSAPKSRIASVGNEAGHYYMVIATLRNQHELNAFKKK